MKPMGPLLQTFSHFGIAAIAFWAGIALFSNDTRRKPASAVQEIIDLSGLSGSEYTEQAKVKILENTDFIRGAETYRIKLGHIYGPERSESMCTTYKSIVIVMKADGMSTSHGHSPMVTLKFPCKAAKASTQTDEIVLPYKQIVSNKAEDSEFDYEGVGIKAEYIDSEWPYAFYVSSISLLGNGNLSISHEDILRIHRSNFNLQW